MRKRAGESQTLYGSVTATEIAAALAERGFEVDRRRIDLEGGIKTLGEHEVRIATALRRRRRRQGDGGRRDLVAVGA